MGATMNTCYPPGAVTATGNDMTFNYEMSINNATSFYDPRLLAFPGPGAEGTGHSVNAGDGSSFGPGDILGGELLSYNHGARYQCQRLRAPQAHR
jgi:hypothetical protein